MRWSAVILSVVFFWCCFLSHSKRSLTNMITSYPHSWYQTKNNIHCIVLLSFALSPTKLSFQTFLSSLRSYKSFFLPLRKCSFKKYFFLFDKCIGFKIGLERNGVFPTSSTCMIWKIKSSLVSFQPKFNNLYLSLGGAIGDRLTGSLGALVALLHSRELLNILENLKLNRDKSPEASPPRL